MIVFVPSVTPVIGTDTLVWPCGIVTLETTEAFVGSSDVNVKVTPPTWAGAEIFNVVVVEVEKLTETEVGLNVAVTDTFTARVSGA
jgi:hypothetical protein